jgi:hypothetical protein
MMKKLLIYLLLATMLLSLAACKNDGAKLEDSMSQKAYTFTHGSTKIAIHNDVAPILASLGKWIDYDESTSCAFVGLDKIYVYHGFEIYTYPTEGKDFVSSIRLYDDTVATEKGIRIGDTRDAVIAAYGTPDQTYDTSVTYETKRMYLQFSLENDIVTDIQYVGYN